MTDSRAGASLPPPETPERPTFVRRLLTLFALLLSALVLTTLLVGASPFLLLNTSWGRAVLRGIANSSDEGHLSLEDASLELFPQIVLELRGLRLARPFEPDAPALDLKRLRLEGLARASHRPGQPLRCDRTRIEGFSPRIDQRWMDEQRSRSGPPRLPDALPHLIESDVVEIADSGYVVRQSRLGTPSLMSLAGIEASLENFRWDLRSLSIFGDGPLTATDVNLNGMKFSRLEIPDLRAEGDRITIPSGVLRGLGGQIAIEGSIRFEKGLPTPDFQIRGTQLDLAALLAASPGQARGKHSPTGRASVEARVTAAPPVRAGEVAEPILEGRIVLEEFQVPVVEKSRLAMRILELLPEYVPGEPPRLKLGSIRGPFAIRDGKVHLEQNQVSMGPGALWLEGTIDQRSGRLQMRLWIDRDATRARLEALRKEGSRSGLLSLPMPPEFPRLAGLKPPPTPRESVRPPDGGDAGEPPPLPSSLETTPTPIPDAAAHPTPHVGEDPPDQKRGPEGLLERKRALDEKFAADARAARERLDARAELARESLAQKASEIKSSLDAKREEAVADLKEKVEATQARVDEKLEPLKARVTSDTAALREALDARRDAIQSEVDARMAEVKAALEGHREGLREVLESRVGPPALCITGTTAAPIVKICGEEVQ